MIRAAIAPLLLSFHAPLAHASAGDEPPEWGGFRGNNGGGLALGASAGAIPDRLDPEATALWRTELAPGYSSPIVAGERVFVTAAQGTELLTIALDRWTGEELWVRELPFDGQRVGSNSSAAPTPCTDGELVFALFHAAGLIAYDVEGEELWRKDLGSFNIPHGLASSPLLAGDALVVVVDQDLGAFLMALDKRTGEELWRTERPGVTHGYATPALWTPAEGPAEVIVSGALQVRGYSLATGEELWWVDGSAWQTKAVPVVVGDRCYVSAYMVPSGDLGLPATEATWEAERAARDTDGDGSIARAEWPGDDLWQSVWFIFDLDEDGRLDEREWEYLGASRRAAGGLFAIELGGRGNVTESHVAWRFDDRRGLPDCPSPLVLGETLYLLKEGGLLSAVDVSSGELRKQGRIGRSAPYFASPVGAVDADGGRFVTAAVDGQVAVLRGGPEWEVLSVVSLDEELWSTPALAGDQVFVRTQEALWCFQSADH